MVFSQNVPRRQSYLIRHNFSQFFPPQVIQALRLCRFSDGEFLCREGEPTLYLHFLVDGRCKVARSLHNGKEALICFYQNFAILGELELICGPAPGGSFPSINTVQATSPVWCLSLPIATAQSLLLNDPLSLRFLCSYLCQKLMSSNRNLSISLNYPVDQRLASYIFCSCQDQQVPFQANYTHLAEYLGCSHRQLLRVLRRFREEGVLKKEGHAYYIIDMDALKKLAGDIYSP